MYNFYTYLHLLLLGTVFCEIEWNKRVDCYPKPGAYKEFCEKLGCIWDPNNYKDNPLNIPLCYFPKGTGYIMKDESHLIKNPSSVKNPFDTDFADLELNVVHFGSIINVKISPPYRVEPLISLPKFSSNSTDSLSFEVTKNEIFEFQIRRESSSENIWDTSLGGLVFGEKYVQIASYLPTSYIYGFGEHAYTTLKRNFTKYTTWGMFARDEPPDPVNMVQKNLYGVHPFYLGLEKDGKAHGVFLLNTHPQEVTFGPSPHLVYRTTGGYLDMYFLPGPTPEEVVKQYLDLVGKPFLPAYYAFGFQLCRYGYKNVGEIRDVVKRTQAYQIPFDVAYADIDYMDRYKDFTIGEKWNDFPSFAQELKNGNMHLVLILDCGIQVDHEAFKRAQLLNASFIEWERYDQVPHDVQDLYPLAKDGKIMLSVVWPDRHVAFPDFYDDTGKTAKWWIEELKCFHKVIEFDGIWIDMNEPAVFGTNTDHPWYFDMNDHPDIKPLQCPLSGKDSDWDIPMYETANSYYYGEKSYLSTKTVCMSGMVNRGMNRIHSAKNLYGLAQLIATQKAVHTATGKRGFVLSRSTFASSGHYGGHWTGDNNARWEDLRSSVISIQIFNIFGIPFIGADICGFNGNTTIELCHRWQQLGAFYPFSRNHNSLGLIAQDPAQWPTVATAARQANLFRYHYLPYLYSLHFKASFDGATVVRPVFFEFPHDVETLSLDYQFMWGRGMMIVPVIQPEVLVVQAYVPRGEPWYSARESDYALQIESGHVELSARKDELIPVLVRGGTIFPRQAPKLTTTESRKSPLELLIAMNYTENNESGITTGELYWDDGESIIDEFTHHPYYHWRFEFCTTESMASLYITATKTTDIDVPTLDLLEIIGYQYEPDLTKFEINGELEVIDRYKSSYSPKRKHLRITASNLIHLTKSTKFAIKWPHHSI